jgi:transcriptional regulator with XRE-family HTH domain
MKTIPNAVAKLMLVGGLSPVKAWREHLGRTQGEVAQAMGISQSAFAQYEKPDAKLRKATREKIASALGLMPEQLDV